MVIRYATGLSDWTFAGLKLNSQTDHLRPPAATVYIICVVKWVIVCVGKQVIYRVVRLFPYCGLCVVAVGHKEM